jgi:hypothetical protein
MKNDNKKVDKKLISRLKLDVPLKKNPYIVLWA